MYPQHPSGWDVHEEYHVDHTNTASTSSSLGHIHHPQPVRATPGSFVWGTDSHPLARQADLDDYSHGATYFPAPSNTLGLFPTNPEYSAIAGSPSGPPRHLPPTPPARLEIQDFDIEGGWSFDAVGRTHYVPHGRIKEVGEGDDDLPGMAQDVDSCTFSDEQSLPPETAPPPRPVHRTFELLPLSLLDRLPLGDGSNTYIAPHPHDSPASFVFNDRPTTPETFSSPPTILTQSQEFNIIKQNLMSLMTASLDIISLHATFAALPKPVDADLALCNQVGETLHAVQKSLERRSGIPPEEWRLRSISCQRKYDYRLMSLRKTLQRLHLLSKTAPRVNQFTKIRDLLKQHQEKLSDLAAKFNATFDRLKLRHFRNLVTNVYNDIQQRVDGRREERKTARAARLGSYGYAFHREGRRPSMVKVS
ncbi:hypothetical protein C8R44DRAFT_783026 [Mycena epipterygia]|nr:hypothetical protein C8R44DRAFT_783026 [Mycena epipterygia]